MLDHEESAVRLAVAFDTQLQITAAMADTWWSRLPASMQPLPDVKNAGTQPTLGSDGKVKAATPDDKYEWGAKMMGGAGVSFEGKAKYVPPARQMSADPDVMNMWRQAQGNRLIEDGRDGGRGCHRAGPLRTRSGDS